MTVFVDEHNIDSLTWQAFERAVCRLLLHEGFSGLRLVGQSHDLGADVIAFRPPRRWLFQVKHWKNRVGPEVVDRTLEAMRTYRAQVPAVVSLNGFTEDARCQQRVLLSERVPLQLWDRAVLLQRARRLNDAPPVDLNAGQFETRQYQEDAIQTIVQTFKAGLSRKAFVVMATGLGKTTVAAEAIRRLSSTRYIRTLTIAHTNELVLQLDRAFWPFLKPSQETLVWNGYERPSEEDIARSDLVFACLNSLYEHINRGKDLPLFDVVLVDECHHVGAQMYEAVLRETRAGQEGGPFLLGLTATPWRGDDTDLKEYFGEPLISVDLITGLRRGFLANVDYRVYTDNIDWGRLGELKGSRLSPKEINRTLFIDEWDDAVVRELKSVWKEQQNPRAIVFCGTIDHAITMRDRINALGFCSAAAIYSQSASGRTMSAQERNRILSDFHDGVVDVVCAVDIFNEGVDVPDVNIIVFQRVTHSRRIFVQQLGRGLRLSPGKNKVIVLDFVSDIRRFAAGIDLKDNLSVDRNRKSSEPMRIWLPHKVTFRRVGGDDPETESFLRQWLEDVASIEDAGEDSAILRFPPSPPREPRR